MTGGPEIAELVHSYVAANDTDLFVFNGPVDAGASVRPVDAFTTLVFEKGQRRSNVAVFLTTYGGDPDGAYRMIRCLRKCYKRVRLLIVGPCKSAGTLIAVGAHELAFAPTGELGPLDIQIVKPDEAGAYGSGLDIFQALTLLTSHAVEKFQEYAETVLTGPLGNVSTKTASDLAVRLTTGILNPIAAQIDPLRLGETQRAMDILREYGNRICADTLKPGALDRLISGYPAHGFVIDQEEAGQLFKSVGDLSEPERVLAAALMPVVRYPRRQAVFRDVGADFPPAETQETPDNGDLQATGGGSADSATNGARPQGSPRAPENDPLSPSPVTDGRPVGGYALGDGRS